VLTVKVAAVEPPGSGIRLNPQLGGELTAGVMLLQESVRGALNPFVSVTVMAEVAEPPCATDAGDSAPAATEKSAPEARTSKATDVP
jgi:hypothetical protein